VGFHSHLLAIVKVLYHLEAEIPEHHFSDHGERLDAFIFYEVVPINGLEKFNTYTRDRNVDALALHLPIPFELFERGFSHSELAFSVGVIPYL